MLTLNGLKSAERFVSEQEQDGNDVRWDGFDKIVFFKPDERGMTHSSGAFREGSWGFDNVFKVDTNGSWHIDYRNVRKVKRNRH